MEITIIQNKIREVRTQYVMFDFDLASIYGVPTKRLKEQVRRNIERFPPDFMFELSKEEWTELVAKCDQFPKNLKHSYINPYVFTQEGIAMLSGVLRSPLAIEMNISIMRAFVAYRNYLSRPLSLLTIEERINTLENANEDIYVVLSELAARQEVIDERNNKPRPKIGYC